MPRSKRKKKLRKIALPDFCFLDLPNELHLRIFLFLALPDLLSIAIASRQFYSISQQTTIWKSLVDKDFSHLNYITTRTVRTQELPHFMKTQYQLHYKICRNFHKKQYRQYSAAQSSSYAHLNLFNLVGSFGLAPVIAIGVNSVVRIWNVEEVPIPILSLQVPSSHFQTYDYEITNKMLIGLDPSERVAIYKLSDYLDDYFQIHLQYPLLEAHWYFGEAKFSKHYAMSYFMKGQQMGETSQMCFWDIKSGKLSRIWDLEDEYVGSFRFLEGKELLVTGHPIDVRLWDLRSSNPLVTVLKQPFELETLCVGISNTLVGCSGDKGYKLYDLRRLDVPLETHDDFISKTCLVFAMNDLFVAAGDSSGKLEIRTKCPYLENDVIQLQFNDEVTNICVDDRRIAFYDKQGLLQVCDFLIE